MMLTEAQKAWLTANPDFGPIGRPRAVKFAEWVSLYPDGTYERLDNTRNPIRLPSLGVGRKALKEER